MNIDRKKTMKSSSKGTDRIKEPSKFDIKFANALFVLGILFSVLVALYSVYKTYNPPFEMETLTFYYSFLLFAILAAILFVLGLRKLRDEFKVNLSVLLITVGISVYGFETYLEYFREKVQTAETYAAHLGDPYETRTKMEVVENLIDAGVEAYPTFSKAMYSYFRWRNC